MEFDKCYLASDAGSDCQALFSRMSGMDVIDRGEGVLRVRARRSLQATAIQHVLDYYGLPLSAAYVFGDSSNDLAMFEYAENCIVMGEHSPVLDPYATFVTRSVEEHGIAYAWSSWESSAGRSTCDEKENMDLKRPDVCRCFPGMLRGLMLWTG